MNKCGTCGRFASTSDGAKCSKCSTLFHRFCVNISNDTRIPNKWQCRECKQKGARAACASSATPSSDSTDNDFSDTLIDAPARGRDASADLANEIRMIRESLTTIAQEMVSFRMEMSKINSNVSELSTRLNVVEGRVTELEQRASLQQKSSSGASVEESLSELTSRINERDQELLLNDIEISGVTEEKGENPLHVVSLLANKIGVTLDERDVVCVMRTGAPRDVVVGADRPLRPRHIILRLARRSVRDNLLKAARVRRGADTTGMNIGTEPRKFYLNERLTRTNKQLFYKAREEGRRNGWRFVWTRDGCIFARRDSNTARHRIRSESDINKIFGK